MNIEKNLTDKTLTVAPDGRIDTLTAPELEAALTFDGVSEMVFDLARVDYISSAGLRVFVRAQKRLEDCGKVIIAHASAPVREIFEVVGFADAFTFA